MKARPKKAYRPLAVMGFGQHGSVAKYEECLPDSSTEAAERVIARKFAARLAELGRPLTVLDERAREPADVATVRPDGSRVGLQICEAIDPVWTARCQMSEGYPPAVRKAFPELVAALKGFRVAITIRPDDGPLPSPRTRAGKIVLAHLAERLQELVLLSQTLERGRIRVRKSQILGVDLTVTLEHTHPLMEAEINWPDGRLFEPGDSQLFVARAIFQKLKKRYSVGPFEELWLVVFPGDVEGLVEASPDFRASQHSLSQVDHPFREVWHFQPLPESIGGTGLALQLWPRK